ncbi:glutathione S-transferase family protein [Microvirga thermotolerans]|nr:glutathione S-transferase family protein [Microvirga thermotolerans]
MSTPALRIFTFSPDWGLPAGGPFDLKLLAWLNLAGIPYEQVFQDDTRKGPKGKNPWIDMDGERLGDTEIIIDLLGKRFDVDLDRGLTPEQRALGHAWRRTFEEHFHQVLEWELLVHPAGAAYMKTSLEAKMPPVIGTLVFTMLRSRMRKQLHARGLARHSPEIIRMKGCADVDALAIFLGDRPYLVADRATSFDAAVFGLLAPMVYWPMDTPVAQHVRSVPTIKAYVDRMKQQCFGGRGVSAFRAAAA